MSLKVKNLDEALKSSRKSVEERKRKYGEKFDEITGGRLIKHSLVETNLKQLFHKHVPNGYIIISAFTGSPADKEWGGDRLDWFFQNLRKSKELKKEINNSGYSHIPVWGGYKYKGEPATEEMELSFVVFNFGKSNKSLGTEGIEKLKELGQQWTKKFNQETYLYAPEGNDSYAYYFDKDGREDMKFNSVSLTGDVDMFFTILSKNRNATPTKNQSFSYKATDTNESVYKYKEGNIYFVDNPRSFSEANRRTEMGELVFNFHTDKYVKKNN